MLYRWKTSKVAFSSTRFEQTQKSSFRHVKLEKRTLLQLDSELRTYFFVLEFYDVEFILKVEIIINKINLGQAATPNRTIVIHRDRRVAFTLLT